MKQVSTCMTMLSSVAFFLLLVSFLRYSQSFFTSVSSFVILAIKMHLAIPFALLISSATDDARAVVEGYKLIVLTVVPPT